MKHLIRVLAAFVAVAVLVAVPALGQVSQMAGTDHDMSSNITPAAAERICVFCHTPHQATAASGQDPLWNHTLSTQGAYGVYDSATFDGAGTISDIGGATPGSASVSNLCMSCHDGTIAPSSLYNPPNSGTIGGIPPITGNANLGTDLTDDHPINFTYDTALAGLDGGLVDPATSPTVTSWLFAGTLQCASCHDPHDDTYQPFMIADNTDSAVCVTCHLK